MTSINISESEFESSYDDGFGSVGESDQIRITLDAVRFPGMTLVSPQGAFSSQNYSIKRRALLALLGYSYARGIYRSEEIERQLPGNLAMQFLSGGALPNANELISFRRHAYSEVRQTLERILIRTNMILPADAESEADRRLSEAVFLDSMDRDC